MAFDLPALFDAHLHPEGLESRDLESLHFFGVRAALVTAHHAPEEATAKSVLQHFDDVVHVQLPRLERAGIKGYAALGLDPRCLPRRGLSEVLTALPNYFRGGKVVAVGEIGLHRGGAAEEEAFVQQLAFARRFKLPVLVHTPHKEKEKVTRRILTLVRESGVNPERVLVDHADGRTVKPIRACGHYAGLTIHPEELKAERAVALIRRLGPERLVLNSDSGDGAGDIAALARTAHLMDKAGLSDRVKGRACYENAAEFLSVDR